VVVGELAIPLGKIVPQSVEYRSAAFELDTVTLTVIETDRLDRGKARERPGKTGRRILTAGKEDERLFGDYVDWPWRILSHADEIGLRIAAINKPAPPRLRALL
jgi:hypothetical protein